jgi:hypothetical protein
MKRLKLTFWDYVIAACLIAIAWGRSVQIALLAVIAFLLYLIVRSYALAEKANKTLQTSSPGQPTPPETQISSDDDNEFELKNDEYSRATTSLDRDIGCRECKSHLCFYSRYDTYEGTCEYEYRIEGTDVLIRLLQAVNEDAGEPKTWDVIDGVVQESDVRARWEKDEGVLGKKDIEKDMAELKERTEWSKLAAVAWGGFKYFALAKNMPRADARRFFRQELERLKIGMSSFTKQTASQGLELDRKYGLLRFSDGRKDKVPEDEWKKLESYLVTLRISYFEFTSGDKLIAVLQEMIELTK